MALMGSRRRHGGRPCVRPARGPRREPASGAAASILATIASDPGHIVTALCQMATLAHVAGRLQKRNDSVDVAADLLARAEGRPKGKRRRRPLATGRQ
jgi:hypothetical protein